MPVDKQIKVAEYLADRVKAPGKCPICGIADWKIGEGVYEMREFNQGTLVVGGNVMPLVPLICGNCGTTLFINAVVAGALAGSSEG